MSPCAAATFDPASFTFIGGFVAGVVAACVAAWAIAWGVAWGIARRLVEEDDHV